MKLANSSPMRVSAPSPPGDVLDRSKRLRFVACEQPRGEVDHDWIRSVPDQDAAVGPTIKEVAAGAARRGEKIQSGLTAEDVVSAPVKPVVAPATKPN